MLTISKVQAHGRDQRYLRLNVSSNVKEDLGLSAGTLVSLEVLDDSTAVLKVIMRN